ncbi:MAG: transcription termination factor NusA [Deferribacteraceae bacterium]|jgi:N utilization substance protein A|nr:transcription termination factor NusA [Deferribacteraceae bacterium]
MLEILGMNRDLTKIADELGRDKSITRQALAEALHSSLAAAVTRKIGKYLEPEIEVDLDRGYLNVKIPKEVTETDISNWDEITVEEAKEFKDDPQLGDMVMVPIDIKTLGVQATLAAKQRLQEKLKEAEKQAIYDEYKNKIGEIVNGTVLKPDQHNTIINIGKTEAILPFNEQIFGERYERGSHIRAVLLKISSPEKGLPKLILSRRSEEFLKKLFEAEIPEVFDGIIQIKAVAREPGDRAKVAVYSISSNIDPVGACIGMKGVRINAISKELRDEKIDVVPWSNDPIKFLCNAISPAKVLLANVFEDDSTVELVVPNDNLSLAIGKRGQNVRLAAALTGWRLTVLDDSSYQDLRHKRMLEQEEELKKLYEIYSLENIPSLTPEMILTLRNNGIDDLQKLSAANIGEVVICLGITEDDAIDLVNAAYDHIEANADIDEDDIDEDDIDEDETEVKTEVSDREAE